MAIEGSVLAFPRCNNEHFTGRFARLQECALDIHFAYITVEYWENRQENAKTEWWTGTRVFL